MDIDNLKSSIVELDGQLSQANTSPDNTLPDSSPQPEPKPYLTIRPSSGWQTINVRQLWHFRDLLLTLAARDVKLRYRQTALGAIWVIIQPLLAAGIFSLVFGVIARLPSGDIPYFVFAYAGLLGWNFFSSILTRSSASLIQNAPLVSKVFFPRLVLPLSTLFSALIDFGVALLLVPLFMVFYGIMPGPGLLLLPVWLLLIGLLALGLGLLTSAMSVSYRDVQYILPVITQFVMYASPTAYGLSEVLQRIPPRFSFLYMLNPLAALLEACRWSLLGQGELHWGYLAYAACVALLIFVVGALSFRKMERRFADVI